MLFKDVKQNYPVYVLDKQELTISQGKVQSVGFPRMDMLHSNTSSLVVDITIEVDNKTATYTIPENLSITYAGNIVLSTDKEGLTHEIEAMRNSAEQVINSVDKQKEILEKSTKLLSELNPAYKEKQEADMRFSSLESQIGEIKEMFANFVKQHSHEDDNNTTVG